jgi:LmbE family N-acetylglucosaminyl deacetylase
VRQADPSELAFERVLVVGAHPDDAEFYAGGTLAALLDRGARVTLVVCTDGGRGGRGIEDARGVRREEQARAAKILGIQRVVRLDRPDGELVCDDELRRELVRAIRSARPELLLAHDPRTLWTAYGSRAHLGHTDHRAAGQAVLDAVYPRAANPSFFPEQLSEEGLALWYPRELWLFDTATPDLRVDIASTLERKLAALREHASQDAGGSLVEAARALGSAVGRAGRPAEAFQALTLLRVASGGGSRD